MPLLVPDRRLREHIIVLRYQGLVSAERGADALRDAQEAAIELVRSGLKVLLITHNNHEETVANIGKIFGFNLTASSFTYVVPNTSKDMTALLHKLKLTTPIGSPNKIIYLDLSPTYRSLAASMGYMTADITIFNKLQMQQLVAKLAQKQKV